MTREEEIFQLALDLTPGDRPVFVADACGDDDALRLRVMQLLAVPPTDTFLAFPATRKMTDAPVSATSARTSPCPRHLPSRHPQLWRSEGRNLFLRLQSLFDDRHVFQ